MINCAKRLNLALKETNEAKEYFSLKEKLENDEYINSLLLVIKQTQDEAKKSLADNDIETYKIKNNVLTTLKHEFINTPLIANYIAVKEDLYQVLQQVVSIISE